MSIPVLSPFDFNKTELLNAKVQNLGIDPTGLGPSDKGLLWIDGSGVIKYWNGTVTKVVGEATGGNATTLNNQGAAFYLSRDNHTGTQLAATISDFQSAVEAVSPASLITSITDTASANLTVTSGALTADVLDSPTVGGATTAQLRDRTTHTGVQAISTVTGLQTALDGKVDDAQVGAANGLATLGADSKIPSSQLPALAITTTYVVADLTARNALTVQEGDVAIVTGSNQSFIYDGTVWRELVSPTDGVTAVTGAGGITSSGGTTPEISITDNGVTSAKMADASVELNTATVTGTLPIGQGGTGATTAAAARTALSATGKFTASVGNGAATQFTVTHNLNSRDVQIQVYRTAAPYDTVMVDVERDTVNSAVVRFATAPTTNAFRVVVVG